LEKGKVARFSMTTFAYLSTCYYFMPGMKTRAVECRDLQTESLAEDCDQQDQPSGNEDNFKGTAEGDFRFLVDS
jgi:hypothetical protein